MLISPSTSSCALVQDLRALYLQNVLGGDTSRASKFKVHVEAMAACSHAAIAKLL